jgi:hypothetical protein
MAIGDGKCIFVETRSLFIFVVVPLSVLAYDLVQKIIKLDGFQH